MAKYKIITGNYIEVGELLGYPNPEESKQYDINRLSYFSYNHTVSQMQESLKKTEYLDDILERNSGLKNASHTFHIVYMNDKSELCSVIINRLQDDSKSNTQSSTTSPEKHFLHIAIIENINVIPSKRNLTIVTDHVLMKKSNDAEASHSDLISGIVDEEISSKIIKSLNSKSLGMFLGDLIQDGVLSIRCFEELSTRMRPGSNVDDWEQKLAQLKELKELIELLPKNKALLDPLNDLITKFSDSDDAFKMKYFSPMKYRTLFNKLTKKIDDYLDTELKDKDTVTKIRLISLAMSWKNFSAFLHNPRKIEKLLKGAQILEKLANGNPSGRQPYYNMTNEQFIEHALQIKERSSQLDTFREEQESLGYSDRIRELLLEQTKRLEDRLDPYTQKAFNNELKTISNALHTQFESELELIIQALREGVKKFPMAPKFITSDVESQITRLEQFASATPVEQQRIKRKYGKRALETLISDCLEDSIQLEINRQTLSMRRKLDYANKRNTRLRDQVCDYKRRKENLYKNQYYFILFMMVLTMVTIIIHPLSLIGVGILILIGAGVFLKMRDFYKNQFKEKKEEYRASTEVSNDLERDLKNMKDSLVNSLHDMKSYVIESIKNPENFLSDEMLSETPVQKQKSELDVTFETSIWKEAEALGITVEEDLDSNEDSTLNKFNN